VVLHGADFVEQPKRVESLIEDDEVEGAVAGGDELVLGVAAVSQVVAAVALLAGSECTFMAACGDARIRP
jgi:hypothetical protein